MNRRGAGVAFCFIGSLLYISRYACTSIYGSNHNTQNAFIYNLLLEGIGMNLTKLSVVFFIIGFGYLVWSEILDSSEIITKFRKKQS